MAGKGVEAPRHARIREQNSPEGVFQNVYFAKQLISAQVVTAYPHQRLEAVSDLIIACNAQLCAVVKPRSRTLQGLVRFSEIVGKPVCTTRILADLMTPPPLRRLRESDGIEKFIELLSQVELSEVVVEQEGGAFSGVITPESFVRWLVAAGPARETVVDRLSPNSPWNPRSANLHELDWRTG